MMLVESTLVLFGPQIVLVSWHKLKLAVSVGRISRKYCMAGNLWLTWQSQKLSSMKINACTPNVSTSVHGSYEVGCGQNIVEAWLTVQLLSTSK